MVKTELVGRIAKVPENVTRFAVYPYVLNAYIGKVQPILMMNRDEMESLRLLMLEKAEEGGWIFDEGSIEDLQTPEAFKRATRIEMICGK